MSDDFLELSAKVHNLVRAGRFVITYHVLNDHPERNIVASDIIEVLKIGSIVAVEPKEVKGKKQYEGAHRYRWFGEDQKDRVLRLILVIKDNAIVVSAAEATKGQAERYRLEDT